VIPAIYLVWMRKELRLRAGPEPAERSATEGPVAV
jgi:hypothetical protein